MNNQPDWSIVKGIVFDIGNVLVDIDYQLTVSNFQALAEVDFSQIVSFAKQEDFFNQFERGEISTAVFIGHLRNYLKPEVTDKQIIDAWNTMLVNYPESKLKLLEKLRSDYRLFTLSNTNELHVEQLDSNIRKHYGKNSFSEYFDRAFYSNEIGMRKPEQRIYEFLIQETQTEPQQLLFIDDKIENILPAKLLGIQTIHLKKPDDLYSFFQRFIE